MVGIVLRPMPMGALAFVSIAFAVLSGTLTIAEATAGFGNTVVWLVVAAFFIATAFVKTGLGTRIAYQCMRLLGKRSLGLAYGFVATDLVLAPAIPATRPAPAASSFRSSSPSVFPSGATPHSAPNAGSPAS